MRKATAASNSSAPSVGWKRCARRNIWRRATEATNLGGRQQGESRMLVTTTENVPNHTVRATLGQVFGVVVRSRGLGGNIAAGLRSIVGGEIVEYTRLVEEA